jgi:NAD+ diphosphatase
MRSSDPRGRPFTGVTLDRVSTERKDPAVIERLHRDSAARAVLAGHDGVLVATDADAVLRTRLDAVDGHAREPILLGLDGSTALFAVDFDALPVASREELTEAAALVPLREAGSSLPPGEAGLAAYATALLNWHRMHRFCSNCGAATDSEEAGFSRHCPVCATNHFPRTDPVVIMTVEHDDQLLLGRRSGWREPRSSVLAGFVSPGESAEEAVVREVQEESGIVVRDPVYVSSQPWPFPSSLMLGFAAQSDGGTPSPRDGELEEVAWYSRREIEDAIAERNPSLRLPPPVSIARFLIDRWVANADQH